MGVKQTKIKDFKELKALAEYLERSQAEGRERPVFGDDEENRRINFGFTGVGLWNGVDAEGFFDLTCKGCGENQFILQGNEDGERIKLICWRCKREVVLRVEGG